MMTVQIGFGTMSAEVVSAFLRVRNWIMSVWIPMFLAVVGDIAMMLGFASESAKALHEQTIQKKRKLNAPEKWDGISHAYDMKTFESVGWTHRATLPNAGSLLLSTGIFANGLQATEIPHNDIFFEHSMDNGLHVLISENRGNIMSIPKSSKGLPSVVYAHIAIHASANDAAEEIYRSSNLSNFFNERIWSFQANVVDADVIAASAAVHGLVDRKKIDGALFAEVAQSDTTDQTKTKPHLRIVVVLDNLIEHFFFLGDRVRF